MAKTPRARLLGAALRREREARGLTLRDLSERIDRNQGDISRWETGDRIPKPEQVAQILTAYGISGELYRDVMSLSYDTDAPVWIATTKSGTTHQLNAVIDAQYEATEITTVSPLMVSGLLQTEPYIRAVMAGGGFLSADDARSGYWRGCGCRRCLHGTIRHSVSFFSAKPRSDR